MSIAHQDAPTQSPIGLDHLPYGEPQEQTRIPDVTSIYGSDGVPDVQRLQAALELARQVLPLQQAEELRQVRSDEELAEELAQQRRFRADWREQAQKDHEAAIARHERDRARREKLAADQASHEHAMAQEAQRFEQQQAEAARERARLLDPNAEVIKARRAHVWLPKLALVPSAVAALVSAAQLAIQGARVLDAPTPVGAAVGAGIDLVFTIALIAIALGRMSGVVTEGFRAGSRGAYVLGELGIGLGLGAASVIAHHLPSANGQPHNASQAWWFLLIPVMFAISAIYGPKLQADTKKRLIQAGNDAAISTTWGGLDETEVKVLRLARWLAEQDRAGLIPGERGEDGLPSVKGVERAIREYLGKCGNPLAKRVRDTYAITSGIVA